LHIATGHVRLENRQPEEDPFSRLAACNDCPRRQLQVNPGRELLEINEPEVRKAACISRQIRFRNSHDVTWIEHTITVRVLIWGNIKNAVSI
jgi:hypothetical protein